MRLHSITGATRDAVMLCDRVTTRISIQVYSASVATTSEETCAAEPELRKTGRRRADYDRARTGLVVATFEHRRRINAIVQLNRSVCEPFDRSQVQRYLSVSPRDQWNAIPNEYRHHRDDEFVDRLRIEERRDELSAAHQPDVLARLRSELADDRVDRPTREFDA